MQESRALLTNGNYQEAILILNEIIKYDTDNKAAFNMRGIAKLELGSANEAIKDFDQSIILDSSDYRSFYNRGNAFYSLEEFQKSLSDYDIAMRLEPKSADIYINRGNVLVQIERFTDAIHDYQFALQLDNANYMTHFNLARTYYISKKTVEAQASFLKCIEIYNTYAPAYYFLGMIALEKDDMEATCLYMRQASELGYQQAAEVLKLYCDSV